MFYLLIILSFVPFWAKPQRYIKEAKQAERLWNYKDASYYYRKCLNKFPAYSGRDSIYFALIDLYKRMVKDSLFLSTIEEFCEEIPSSVLIPEVTYKKGTFFEEGGTLLLPNPLKAESLYKSIIEEHEESAFVKKARERIKYLNTVISLPVGKVYKCEICGKLLKADKILRVKRKNKAKYLKEYSTEEIRKDRCYEHQLIKVETGVIQICPRCGRILSKSVYGKDCMRIEKDKYNVKKIKASHPCIRCQDVIFRYGESIEEIESKLGPPNNKLEDKYISEILSIYKTRRGDIILCFRYNNYSGEAVLVNIKTITQPNGVGFVYASLTGKFKRENRKWYKEGAYRGELSWTGIVP